MSEPFTRLTLGVDCVACSHVWGVVWTMPAAAWPGHYRTKAHRRSLLENEPREVGLAMIDRLTDLDALWQRIASQPDRDDPDDLTDLLTAIPGLTAELRAARAVVEAIGEHGVCTCNFSPGYPRGDRHAPDCDYDPDLRAALDAWVTSRDD